MIARPAFAALIASIAIGGASLAPSGGSSLGAVPGRGGVRDLDVAHWRIIARESGPVNYYEAASEGATRFVRAHYRPPWRTAVLGVEIPESDRTKARRIHWKWRAQIFPRDGDECAKGREDSAAVVYLTWKRGMKFYTLKYVWSTDGARGAVCGSKRTVFVDQDTIVLESGGATGVWKTETIDLDAEFRLHFEQGNPRAAIPDFVGVAIMTDGDQTRSQSAADYADFLLDD